MHIFFQLAMPPGVEPPLTMAEAQLPWESAMGSFCSTTTFLPSSSAFTAATTPAAPAPQTTMSQSISWAKSLICPITTAEAFTSSGMRSVATKVPSVARTCSTLLLTMAAPPLAWAMHCSRQDLAALVVMVAEETPSMSVPWAPSSCSMMASLAA